MLSKRIQILLCIMLIAVFVCTAVFASSGGAADFVTPDTTSLDLNSCRHTHEDEERGKAQPNLLANLSGYTVISENRPVRKKNRITASTAETGISFHLTAISGAATSTDNWTGCLPI